MKVKVFGMLAAIQVKVFSALQEIAKPTDEGILDWLLTDKAQATICKACQAAWDVLVAGYEDANKILESLSIVTIPATTKPFVAREKFKFKKDGGICSYISPNFTSWFLNGDGKIEGPMAETTLRYKKLPQFPVDTPIIAGLGGKAKAETTLTAMFFLMKKQKNGKDGILLTGGYGNIFYIKDIAGVLRTVRAYWSGDGWDIGAILIESPRRLDGGGLVFSRLPAGQAGNSEPLVT